MVIPGIGIMQMRYET